MTTTVTTAERVTGIVANLSSKLIKSTSSGKQFRIHLVELDDGRVLNTGFKQPYAVGDSVDTMAEFKFGEWKQVAAPVPSGTPSVPSTPPSGSGAKKAWVEKTFPVPTTHGDMAIIRQNALTNAVNVYTHEFGGEKGVDEAIEHIIFIAYKFCEFSSGHREVRIEKELSGKKGKPGAE